MSTRKNRDDDTPPLSILKYLNLLAFISNVVASFGEGVFSQFGEETIVSLSEKYEVCALKFGLCKQASGNISLYVEVTH